MKVQDYIEIRNKLLEAFDKAIAEGNWEVSLFFRNVEKRLRELREFVATELVESEDNKLASAIKKRSNFNQENYLQVCISIYQAEGDNLERWKNAIKALAGHSISRPVYRLEDHAQAMIRGKADTKREAYVIVCVKNTDIIQPYAGKIMEDRFGHELLTLKEGCVKLEHIIEFVHENKRYSFDDGELVFKNEIRI